MSDEPAKLDIYRTKIPMRSGFEHAAASRQMVEAIVVRLTLADGRTGWGETLPREYVTGETLDSVVADLRDLLWPAYCGGESVPPNTDGGRVVNAAACALELAHLDATAGFTPTASGRRIAARASGVLGSSDPAKTSKQLTLMRLYGLRDFKLKLGLDADVDSENLRVVRRQLGKAIAAGKCTLRVDVNGGWDADTTPQRVEELAACGVCVVEQPVICSPSELVNLAADCALPLMADETLLTDRDGQDLLTEPNRVWWNIRISKNGGYQRALKLSRLAAARGVRFTIGCMVGESGILSAAQRRLLQAAPPATFVEGNFGKFLLGEDLTSPSPRIGYGGRLKALPGRRLGVSVRPEALADLAELVATLPAP